MRPGVEANQPDAWRRLAEAEGLRQVRAQAVLEEERDPCAFVAVMKLNVVVLEERHSSPPSFRRQFLTQELQARRSVALLEPVHDQRTVELR